MKRLNIPMFRSKAALYFLCVAAGISVFVAACKKDDKDSTPALSQQEVATSVSAAVTNGGVIAQTEQAALLANGYLNTRKAAKATGDDCGYTASDEIKLSSEANAIPYFSIDYTYSLVLTCGTDQTFKSFDFTFAGKTALTTKQMSVANTSDAKFSVTGLDEASKTLVFNQTFNNDAAIVSKDASLQSFKSKIKYTASNVTVDKATLAIVSGTADVSISGTTANGKEFSYEGKITYKGSRKAVFTINGGGDFDLNW